MELGFIIVMAAIVLVGAALIYCGYCFGRSSVMRHVHRVYDVYERKDKKMTARQLLNDKHMKLVNELSNLNALDTEKTEDGKEEIALWVWKPHR